MRDVIFKFYESKYACCLKMLDAMKVSHRTKRTTDPHLLRRSALPEVPFMLVSLWHLREAACPWNNGGSLFQDNLLLDMYLAPHVWTLYTQIRNRALIQVCELAHACKQHAFGVLTDGEGDVLSGSQYFSPYVSADMNKMALAFNSSVGALEDELSLLILEGLINARIDSHSKARHREMT